jgi:GTP-binding protein EngB required for normal cell division
VITKVDKVKQNEKVKRTKAILDAFGSEGLQYVHYSATKRVGRRELIKMINEALREELLGEEDGATE